MGGLRDEHRELTRRKVLAAVLDLVADGSLDELSVPAVSRRSGVSVATIYRHFPSRDELLSAAAAEPWRRAKERSDGAGPGPAPAPAAGDGFAAFHRTMWREFAGHLPLLRHQLSSEAGRELRRIRLPEGRRQLAAYVERFGVDPASAAGERLIALLLLVTGSVGLIELHDRQRMAVDDAIDASWWAVHALIDATIAATQPSTGEGTA